MALDRARVKLALARRWPLLVGLAVFLLHLVYLWPGGPWTRRTDALILGQDEGTVLYDSLRISRGEVMYDDFFMFQGPVFYYANAGLFLLTGGPSIGAARLLHLLWTAASAALLAVLVARYAGRLAGIGAALVHACVLVPMWPFAYSHWLAETLALAGLVFLTREETRPRDQVLGGACMGLSLMTIQSVGLPVLVAAVGALAAPGLGARDWRAALRRPGLVLAGAAAAVGPIALYFAAHGALGDLYYAMFVWTKNNYRAGQGQAITYAWWVEEAVKMHRLHMAAPWRSLAVAGLRLTQYLPYASLAGAAVAAPIALWRLAKRREGYGFAIAAGVALAGCSPLWLAPLRPDLTHVAYVGSLGMVGAAVALAPAVKRWRAARVGATALFCAAGLAMLVNYGAKTALTWKASRKLGTWRQEALKLPNAARLAKLAGKDERIVVGAMSGFYYMYVRPAAVPFTYIPAGWVALFTEPQWRRLADAIVTRRPRAMSFIGKQWGEIVKRRPELEKLYRNEGGLLVRVAPAPAAPR